VEQVIRFLLGLVNPLATIGEKIAEAYAQKANAQTEQQRIEAEERIRTLEARRDVLVAEQGNWLTRSIRPLLALPFVIYLWKLVVWDKVLAGFTNGSTDGLSTELKEVMLLIVGAYFLDLTIARFKRGG
jgi:hypothetical protein